MVNLPQKFLLKDGRIAIVSMLSKKDSVGELNRFINTLIEEKTYLIYDRKTTMKEEKIWKKKELEKFQKGEGFLLVARINEKIAGTSGAGRDRFKGKNNISLGIAIANEYRGIGLGELLLQTNITIARKMLKPKNIYLSVLSPNKPAQKLYRKLGFRKFAVFPKWLNHNGKFVDQIFMKLSNCD